MSENKKFTCFILIMLLVFIFILKFFSFLNYKNDKQTVKIILQDIETIQARKQLIEINKHNKELNKLIAYCVKQTSKPILISDFEDCKNSSLNYLGYSNSYRTLKQLATRPLHKELIQEINKEYAK